MAPSPRNPETTLEPRRSAKPLAHAEATAIIAVATTVSWLARGSLALGDIAMLHTLGVVIVATRLGLGPALLAAGLSVLSYNFFFIPPVFAFGVEDGRHLLTFAMIFGVGTVISTLTDRLRRQEYESRTRKERTSALYALSRALGNATTEGEALTLIARRAARTFRTPAAVLCPDASGVLTVVAREGDLSLSADELRLAQSALEARDGAPPVQDEPPDEDPEPTISCSVLRVGKSTHGVLILSRASARSGSILDRAFVEAFADQGALALTRARLAEEVRSTALRAQTEAMRSALLSAVSHDLRTPLSAITGAATVLRDGGLNVSPVEREDLTAMICEEADRMERLVRNLLDMTRVESKSLDVKREWASVEELVASALSRMEQQLQGRTTTLDMPDDLPLVQVDPILLGQVFVNLVENVAKHTPRTSGLEIRARAEQGELRIEVADRGPGFLPDERERVFEKFFRGARADKPGAGLGLAICRGIVEAHGGSLTAENRADGGACLRISLPLPVQAPAVVDDPAPPTRREGRAA